MLSLILQEHQEGRSFVQKMLDQAARIQMQKEVIYVTSMNYQDFYNKYGPFNYKFPVSVIGNIQSCGAARNAGGKAAVGDTLLYMDSHVCFNPENVNRLLQTLEAHPNAIVAPAVQAIDFPSCRVESDTRGYGVYFRFAEGRQPFEWVWAPPERTDQEFAVPFVCGCAFSMKKQVFNVLSSYGGFLGNHQGLSWEEEKSFRLWRLGYPTYSEPRAVFGHLYKGYANKPKWDEHSVSGYYRSRVAGFYINVFNKVLWDYIENMLIKSWGNEYFKNLEIAKQEYGWLRNRMMPLKDKVNENWLLRKE